MRSVTLRDQAVAAVAEWRKLGVPGLPKSDVVLVDMVLADLRAKASWEYRFQCAQWFTHAALGAAVVALTVAWVCVMARGAV